MLIDNLRSYNHNRVMSYDKQAVVDHILKMVRITKTPKDKLGELLGAPEESSSSNKYQYVSKFEERPLPEQIEALASHFQIDLSHFSNNQNNKNSFNEKGQSVFDQIEKMPLHKLKALQMFISGEIGNR